MPPNDRNDPKQTKAQQMHAATAQTAKTAAQQVGGPGFASRLGQPVDLTGGIPMGKSGKFVHPNPLPNPGTNIEAPPVVGMRGIIPPGAIPSPDMLEEMAANVGEHGLPDDHDSVAGPIGRGPTQPPQRQVRQQQPIHRAAVKPEHPVLTKLKEDLGISSIEPIDVMVGGHLWTMKVMSETDISICARMADLLSQTNSDYKLRFDTAVVSVSIIAIDRHPAWEVMGIELPPDTLLTDPLMPPDETRRLAALKVFDFISGEGKTQLSSRLYEAYTAKVDPHGVVKSSLTDPNNPQVKFVCTTPDCQNDLIDHPLYEPGTKNIMPFFCKIHGTVMEPKGKINDAGGLDPLD